MDPLAGMGSLNLGGTAPSHNPGFPTSLSSAFSNPQSPAKAFPALSNPNPSTPFGGIGSLSTQLSGTEPGALALPGESGMAESKYNENNEWWYFLHWACT